MDYPEKVFVTLFYFPKDIFRFIDYPKDLFRFSTPEKV